MTNKIPHIIHIFPSFGRGGVPIKICHAINYFEEKARHTIISTNDDFGSEDIINDGLYVAIDRTHHDIRGSLLHRIKRYRTFLKNTNADLLITYNWGAVEWALANSFGPIMRHIHVESGFGPEETHNTMPRRNLFRRAALRNIEFLSVPATTLVEIAKSKWKIPEKKIKYIPNGVDIEKFTNIDTDYQIAGLDKKDKEIIVGTIAPLRPEKNISRLIKCFSEISEKNSKLVIMGEGAERRKLAKLASNLGMEDKIIFTGHISNPEKAIGILDIFAISSDTEQMPNAVNEAMAAGLPVVGLSVGDVKHMVSDINKDFIVPAGDDEAFSAALKTLINDKKAQISIGKANAQHVRKHYDRIDMYKKYAELWGIN
ncbi:MAG: glycosyltransferase [Emcibacteraceae bacterium]|nr:glycosyltransferase [Emcibacteraceae bacterium]